MIRTIFEYARKIWRKRRARQIIPDDAWREVCIRHAIPLNRIECKYGDELTLKFERTVLTFPKTSAAMSVVRAYEFLYDLDAYTECEMTWDHARNSMRLSFGRAVYFSDCSEEIYILWELHFVGDYDISPVEKCVLIDVGANVGFTSIFLASANPNLVIEGYEPLKLNFDKAERNLLANPHIADRVVFSNYGLFETEGVQVISSEVGNRGMSSIIFDRQHIGSGSVDSEHVNVLRASDVVRSVSKRHPGRRIAMKMDCEGSEYAIIRDLGNSGDVQLIQFIILEWHRLTRGGNEVEGLRDLLVQSGFHVYLRGRMQSKSSVGMAIAFKASI